MTWAAAGIVPPSLRQSTRDAFMPFTQPLEGVVPFMYLDVRGLVTTAIGVLIDPASEALSLPFVRRDGAPATHAEIAAEWAAVKARQDLRLRGGLIFKNVTSLRLTNEGVELVVMHKLDAMVAQLGARFPDLGCWPADAQLATLSMAWACGAHFHFATLEAALRAQDFRTASVACRMNEVGNPGLKPRNAANRALYENAADVIEQGLDPDILRYALQR